MASLPVTVLIPSYRHARFIGPCLQSVLRQTVLPEEILVVDDGSPDETVQVAESIAKDHPIVRVVQNHKNVGTYANLNRGLDLIRREWVAILNSDDLWQPTKLEQQFKELERTGRDFSLTLGDQFEGDGQVLPVDQHGDLPTELDDLLPLLLFENRFLASSLVFRQGQVRFRDELNYSGDWIALLDLAMKGPCALVREPLTLWRQHETNSYVRSPKQVEEEIYVREQLIASAAYLEAHTSHSERAKKSMLANKKALLALQLLSKNYGRARDLSQELYQADGSKTSRLRMLGCIFAPGIVRSKMVGGGHFDAWAPKQRKDLWPK